MAEPAGAAARRRGDLDRPRPQHGLVLRYRRAHAAVRSGSSSALFGMGFGLVMYTQLRNAPVHKSMLEVSRAHLRDLQDLPRHAAEVHPHPRGLHRRRSSSPTSASSSITSPRAKRFRSSSSCSSASSASPAVVPGRLVRHPREHVRELAHGVRRAQGQAVPLLRDPAQGGHEHRHAPHQRRADPDALHPPLHPGRAGPARASSASPSASRSARRRSASRAASSRRSPTSARTS